MENASKALLIAATILIGILIIGVFVYLTNNYEIISDKYKESTSIDEKQKYNNQILKNITVKEGVNYITAQGIVTILNLVKENSLNIEIEITISGWTKNQIENKQSEFLKEKSMKSDATVINYKVDKIEYTNGLISKIKIINP